MRDGGQASIKIGGTTDDRLFVSMPNDLDHVHIEGFGNLEQPSDHEPAQSEFEIWRKVSTAGREEIAVRLAQVDDRGPIVPVSLLVA